MKYKIGIFGSVGSDGVPNEVIFGAAKQVGATLGEHADEVVIITGGCSGSPYVVAHEASQKGVEVWGFSPVRSREEQLEFTPNDDLSTYTKLRFVPEDLPFSSNRRVCMKYRNVLSTSTCDAGIIIAGTWGSLNEFTNLIDMQKTVGVLTGTGGIADELSDLSTRIKKAGQGEIIFNSDPQKLVEQLLAKLQSTA